MFISRFGGKSGIRQFTRFAASAFRRFGSDRRGSFATIFALSLIPISVGVGAAVDYSFANKIKARLDAAADAAALSAVNKVAMGNTAAQSEAAALNMFQTNAASIKHAVLGKSSVKVTDSGTGRVAAVKYAAKVDAAFMGLVGINKIPVSGSASAASALPTYMDFYLLLDNTPSMGVGATNADIGLLMASTPDKCAFACHDTSTGNNYYNLAKKIGAQMRIDVMRKATQELMDTAGATQINPGQFRMAIYTFGQSAEKMGLQTIQSLTTNLKKAKSAAEDVDLMSIPYQNYNSDTQTDFHSTLAAMNSAIGNPGDGSKSSSPMKILFFVSDGVADRAIGSPACLRPTTNGKDPKTGKSVLRCQEPLDAALCTSIKKRGIKIAVLYTTYLPLPSNAWYNTWIAPFSSDIAKKMQDCASPDFYFEVSPTEGISEAMTALFQKAVQTARLTK